MKSFSTMDNEFDDEVEEDLLEPKYGDFEESDEATEDASETDFGQSSEYKEIKEEVYKEQFQNLKNQLELLKEGAHPKYNEELKILEKDYDERLRLNQIWKEYLLECVERDYIKEKKLVAKELKDKKIELKESLISELEEKRKVIEAERYSLELTVDPTETKPTMTRKLRRRPHDPIPVLDKRSKIPQVQINYSLAEKEVESDLKTILSGMNPEASEGHQLTPRVEDGKLMFERKWFHRGQPVFVEGRNMVKFSAVITAIGPDYVWVKKVSDSTKVRISLSQLIRGKASIKRRAA